MEDYILCSFESVVCSAMTWTALSASLCLQEEKSSSGMSHTLHGSENALKEEILFGIWTL